MRNQKLIEVEGNKESRGEDKTIKSAPLWSISRTHEQFDFHTDVLDKKRAAAAKVPPRPATKILANVPRCREPQKRKKASPSACGSILAALLIGDTCLNSTFMFEIFVIGHLFIEWLL